MTFILQRQKNYMKGIHVSLFTLIIYLFYFFWSEDARLFRKVQVKSTSLKSVSCRIGSSVKSWSSKSCLKSELQVSAKFQVSELQVRVKSQVSELQI